VAKNNWELLIQDRPRNGWSAAREFAAVSGIKKTSAVFRQAFHDTLDMYANVPSPAANVQASRTPTAAPDATAGVDPAGRPSDAATPQAAHGEPTSLAANQITGEKSFLTAFADQAGLVDRFSTLDAGISAEVRREVVMLAGKQATMMILGGRYLLYLPSEATLETIATQPNGVARVQQMISLFREAMDQATATNGR